MSSARTEVTTIFGPAFFHPIASVGLMPRATITTATIGTASIV